MSHAILSPSAASRWLNCTPSARLEQQFPDTSSDVAKEGTLAHSLGELLISLKSGAVDEAEYQMRLKAIQADKFYDPAMMDHCEDYAVFVMERFAEAQSHTKDAILFLEQRLNLTDYIPESFGTGDTVIIADAVLDIIDLKYGKGVLVSAEQNRQMMLYSLGALREFDYMYAIDKVRMTIFQPRLDSISTWEMDVVELKQWAENELKPRAALAFEGKGDFVPGKHCQFCKVRATCRAHAEMHLQAAKYDFKNPDLLDDDEISDVLTRSSLFKNWLTAVEEHALHEAVHNDKKWPGYKLVEGRSNRKYADTALVADKLINAGFAKEIIYKPAELLGITEMEKKITKKTFATELDGLIIKPPGKPALVPVDDKRPEYNSAEGARKDFENA